MAMQRNYRVSVFGNDIGTLPHSHFEEYANDELINALKELDIQETHIIKLVGGNYEYTFIGFTTQAR